MEGLAGEAPQTLEFATPKLKRWSKRKPAHHSSFAELFVAEWLCGLE
jgi:hypothetical protein